jgi:hypothetical protein
MVRQTLVGISMSIAAATLIVPLVARAERPARIYQPRPDIKLSQLEKVRLRGRYNLYLVRDQQSPGQYAAAKGGKRLLIGRTSTDGAVLLGSARLLGNRVYHSRQAIYRKGIRVSNYEEKSVVAYLPSKDPKSPYPRFYTVIGPKDGKGPLLIKRRPSQLVGGKPVEYSILDL